MTRNLSKRLERLERELSRRAAALIPIQPTAVFIPHFAPGTPEVAQEEQAFREAHAGEPIIIVRTVSSRLDGTFAEWHSVGRGLVVPRPLSEEAWENAARQGQADLKRGVLS